MAPNGDVPSFHRSNRTGAAMAFFGYNHIDDMQVKLYIGTYTSLVVYIEDAFSDKLEVIQDFNTRFTSGETQRLPVLTALATHLRKTSAYFNDVQANAIITASLNFMASLWMENHFPEVSQCQAPVGEDVTLSSKLLAGCDCGFPTYVRNMSGNGQPYAMFIFPKDLDSKVYAQAIPTLTLIAVYFNDILSFFKEELAGEINYVSLLANHYGVPKMDVLQHVADQVSSWLATAENLLYASKPALEAMRRFIQGFVDYHFSAARYRLSELMGDVTN
ncbi:terpene cyclase [Pleurotus pulmonarius]|nr:terpene cyclase [Pleurotus pulmonarius]KAF4593975.1 terpene cyclase [Pleurotus pulmonarius]